MKKLIFFAASVLGFLPSLRAGDWKQTLNESLPLLGHRNWIVVVDSAYPLQTSPGVRTVNTGSDQLEVVDAVLGALSKTRHVRPTVYTDKELAFVPEADAKGIAAYRTALADRLPKAQAMVLPHEEIIRKLDEAGKTFNVLVLKTNLTLPYTSVFFQLECGYWTAAAEEKLRKAMKADAGQ